VSETRLRGAPQFAKRVQLQTCMRWRRRDAPTVATSFLIFTSRLACGHATATDLSARRRTAAALLQLSFNFASAGRAARRSRGDSGKSLRPSGRNGARQNRVHETVSPLPALSGERGGEAHWRWAPSACRSSPKPPSSPPLDTLRPH
jgi:hypothetical protein